MTKVMYLAVIIELVGIILTGIGVGVELAMHADIGYVAMTIGSMLLAMGGIIWGKFCKRGN
jgi:hypothetical protein